MNCQDFLAQLDEYLAGELSTEATGEASRHLHGCGSCQRKLARLQSLRAALRSQPVPPARAGFFEQAMQNAQRSSPRRGVSWTRFAGAAVAAGLAAWIAFGGALLPIKSPNPPIPGVTLALHETQTIRLSFNAERELTGATLRIRLPDGVEVRGYPGQRDIEWRTDLARGVNMLALPLHAVAKVDGAMTARLEHGDRKTEFSVRIVVGSAESVPASRS